MFWMPFTDLISHFENCSVCFTKDSQGNAWHSASAKAVLESTQSDDNASCNHHFMFTLDQESEVLVTLCQEDPRIRGVAEQVDIAFSLLTREGDEGEIKSVSYAWLDTAREVSSVATQETLKLPPGTYLVVPWSSGCRLAPVAPQSNKAVDWDVAAVKPAVAQLHRRFADADGHVTGDNLCQLIGEQSPEKVLELAGQPERPGLTQRGILKWLRHVSVLSRVVVSCCLLQVVRCP